MLNRTRRKHREAKSLSGDMVAELPVFEKHRICMEIHVGIAV